MHSLAAYTLLASASLAVAIDPRFEFPDTVPLVKRQQPGTPQYACHEDCGLLITLARDDSDYCDSDEWNERYGRCMSCANTYDIWKYYGSGHEETEHAHTSTEAGHSEAHEHTTLATHAAETTHAANPTKTHEAGHTSVDEIGTVGVTATSTPLPSTIIVNGAAKQVGFSTAMAVVALAMFGLY
ncbi:hypothetical protein FPRO05_04300 [Fusarium proliferatum]|uniref:Uncharacterized protein n=1 Tax=Gibberella intermedia TaxID=948311 RepID=A0A365MRF7_GIBIN|nr:hypothetical protein FPRO05_04300 [Fusarium proliferatum]